MKKKYTFRKFFNDIHLWMGLASGLVLFVVCLSGTIYTFRAEIERWVSPSKYYVAVPAGAQRMDADILIARLEKQLHGTVTSLQIPADTSMSWQVGIKGEGKKKDAGKNVGKAKEAEVRPKTYFINPYTGAVVGEQGGGATTFFSTMMKLHRWLLLPDSIGRIIVGIATLIFVFLIISGLVIWFPARLKNWKQGFRIFFKGNWKRVNHDLHNTLGFYSFLVLLIMSLTGLCWSFEWYKDGMSTVLGSKVFKGRGEKPLLSAKTADSTYTVPYTDHIAIAHILFPYTGDLRVTFPATAQGAVVINKNKTGFFAFSGADKVQLDRFTGNTLKIERFGDKRFGEKIADSIKPLHTGEIFGTFSKILYFIVCLIATSLPVTGTIIWINKLKKKTKRKGKQVQATRPSVVTSQSYEVEIGLQ